MDLTNDAPRSEVIWVLLFTAPTCKPCLVLKPVLQKLASEYDFVRFKVVDLSEQPSMQQKYNVFGLPTVVYIAPDGTELYRLSGLRAPERYAEPIREWASL